MLLVVSQEAEKISVTDNYICKRINVESSCCGSVVINTTSIHEDVSLIPGLALWVRIQQCHELWCRLQTWLRSGIAVAVA